MWPDFFASTFYSMITKHKDKYGVVDDDVSEYYFESLFILVIQTICSIAILRLINWDGIFSVKDNFPLLLCQFLTVIILHTAQVLSIRNGQQMCKFLIYHNEECSHPISAFVLSILVMSVNMLCEFTNICYVASQDRVADVIANFIAFRCLIEAQDFYAA